MPEFLRTLAIISRTSDPAVGGIGDLAHLGAAPPALADGDAAEAGLDHAAGDVLRLLARQIDDGRRDPLRVPDRGLLRGQLAQALRHARQRRGRDGVDGDAVAAQLARGDDGEGGDAGLGRAVVGLADVAVDARRGAGVDDAALDRPADLLALVAPVGRGVARGRERALQVHLDHGIPLALVHVGEHAVAQDAGVVDEDVEPAEMRDRRVDHRLGALPAADVLAVGDRLAAGLLDRGDDLAGGRGVLARAVHPGADVVDHHLGAVRRQQQGMLAADAASRTRDDRNPTLA